MRDLIHFIRHFLYFRFTFTTWETFNPIREIFRKPDFSVARDEDGILDLMWCGGIPFTKFGFVFQVGEDSHRYNEGKRLGFEHRYVNG